MSAADLSDPTDCDLSDKELQIHAILQMLLKEKETFTEDDWIFQCSMWPNLDWKLTDAKQALKQLLRQGRIVGLEDGEKYQPSKKLSTTSGEGE